MPTGLYCDGCEADMMVLVQEKGAQRAHKSCGEPWGRLSWRRTAANGGERGLDHARSLDRTVRTCHSLLPTVHHSFCKPDSGLASTTTFLLLSHNINQRGIVADHDLQEDNNKSNNIFTSASMTSSRRSIQVGKTRCCSAATFLSTYCAFVSQSVQHE